MKRKSKPDPPKEFIGNSCRAPTRKTYSLPIGPQHPMYVEAENLVVTLDGETITGVDVNIGYMHRGIEELMQKRNYIQGIYLAERICGICSGVHSATYTQVVENLLGIDIPERAKLIRMIILELERMHSHMLFLGLAGYQIGLDTVFMYSWKDREHVLDMLEMVSGNRVNYGMHTIGGVRRDIPGSKSGEILKILNLIEKRTKYYENLFTRDKSIISRTVGLGKLSMKQVLDYCIIGPVARGSGVRTDIRADVPYLLYKEMDWKVVVKNGCDVHSRVLVKILELYQSIRIIRACISRLVKLDDRTLVKRAPLIIPPGEAIALTEAPRGELIYYARSNGTDMPERMRIRTPTFMNIMYCLPPILEGQQLADLPMIVSSVDPCFSCCDRVTLIDQRKGSVKTVDEAWLKRLGQATNPPACKMPHQAANPPACKMPHQAANPPACKMPGRRGG
jgi:membrane-bound hydrogenase subunit alpha